MTEETRIIKTLISEIRFELEKILSLKDDMLLLKGSFGDIAPDKFKCSAAGYLLHNFYNGAENIFKSIASVFGNKFDKEEWHSTYVKKNDLRNRRYKTSSHFKELI